MDFYELVVFAKAYNRLGTAVQEQLDDVMDYNTEGTNPNAVALIKDKLLHTVPDEEAKEQLETAIEEFEEGRK